VATVEGTTPGASYTGLAIASNTVAISLFTARTYFGTASSLPFAEDP
jgi:hypothetical protein